MQPYWYYDQGTNGGPGPDGSSGRGEAWDWDKRVYTGRDLHEVLYGGITLYGVKAILKKELSDHFSSYRFIILFALTAMVSLITAYMVGLNIKQNLEGVVEPKYIFLMLFTSSGAGFSLVDFVGFFGLLIGMILGFDTINRERSEGSLGKLLSQPIYRDTVLNEKFLAGVCVIAVMMVSIVLIITGLGLSMVGVILGIEEVWRIVVYLVIGIVYIVFWLGITMLFSILFRSVATSALAAVVVWIFFPSLFFWVPMQWLGR